VRPVSDAFLRTLLGSHRVFARAKILVSFQSGTQPTGSEIPIVDGNVRADASADVRSSVELATDGNGTWPTRTDGLLAPYGNELFCERGIDYGNGTVEVVSLGYFRIDRTSQDDGPNGVIRLGGSDRMAGIIDARLTEPVQFPAGTSVEDVFDQLVHEVYPLAEIEYDFVASGSTFDTAHIAEEDRYGFLKDVAQSRGKIMYWDYRGILKVESPPDPDVPVYTINSGTLGNMVRLSRTLSRQGVYNAVVARGEAVEGSDPVTALAVDDNVTSPTYWNGRFGRVPRFYYSSFLTSYSQAYAAAQSILRRATGLPYSIGLETVPNPALEPYDPVQILMPDSTDVHVIDSLTIPLTSQGTMSGATRKLISTDVVEPVT
jgi:hypothetical protein